MFRTAISVIALAALCLPLRAQLVNRKIPPADAVERGSKLFVSACGFCHGASGRGGEGAPSLVRSALVLDDEDGDHIAPVVLNGRVERGMPKFAYSKQQISDLAAFLRSRTQSAINRRSYKTLDLVTGDATAGEVYFRTTGGCSGCHSPSGDLAKIAARLTPEMLQERFLYPNPPPRPGSANDTSAMAGSAKRVTVTVKLSSGESITGSLAFLNDFDVALTDASGNYRSFDLSSGIQIEIHDPFAKHEELLAKYTDADIHNLLAYLETLK